MLYGGEGDDTLVGSDQIDLLYGDAGNDTLRALDGDDLLNGGTGDDELSGGIGKDTFAFGDDYGVDRLNDGGAAAIFDFSLVSQGLTGFINRGYTRFVDAWGNELSARRLEAPVTDIILSPSDDRVYFAEFVPDLALNITDPGGNDSYYMPAGRADATSAPGSIHIDDQIGAFDNIVLEHSQPNTHWFLIPIGLRTVVNC